MFTSSTSSNDLFGPRTQFGRLMHATKYRAPEETFDDYCVRYSRAVTDNEEDFRRCLKYTRDQSLLPAGRQQHSVGRPYLTTAFNCFVNGQIPDSLQGIMDALTEGTMTLRTGGGVGWDFSSLRPEGEPIRGLGHGSFSSGPISFMKIWDIACQVILTAGHRRGAMMGVLRVDHPDILKFITAKKDGSSLKNFNISVAVTDEFMEALSCDGLYSLKFNGTDHAQVRAVDVWAIMMENNWDWAEPGVLFMDRINERNPLKYCETIFATNPCVVAGTLITTPKGLIPVEEIKIGDRIFTAKGTPSTVTERQVTKDQPVFKVVLKSGQTLRVTAGHIFHSKTQENELRTRSRSKSKNENRNGTGLIIGVNNTRDWGDWRDNVRLQDLRVGDKLRLRAGSAPHNSLENPFKGSQRDYGLLMGVLLGDGTYTERSDYIKISVGSKEIEWIDSLRDLLKRMGEEGSLKLNLNLSRGSSAALQLSQTFAGLIRSTPLVPNKSYNKSIPIEFINSNSEFLWGLLDGLISTDGAVDKHQLGGILKFCTSSYDLALGFQRVSHLLGMNARIYLSKRVGQISVIEGVEVIGKRDMYEVCLIGEHFHRVHKISYLSHPRKQTALSEYAHTFKPQGDLYETEIVSIEKDGTADVYDLFESITDTWITEGVVSRGCGEQPLPPYGACLLGSINMVKFLRPKHNQLNLSQSSLRPDIESPNLVWMKPEVFSQYEIDYDLLQDVVDCAVRAFDNVIDRTNFPLAQQKEEAKAKRRMGLGYTGMANCLEILGYSYGSPQYLEMQKGLGLEISLQAYKTSIELSREKGAFPLFDKDKYCEGWFVNNVIPELKDDIYRYGLRNGLLTSQAPCGTISMVADNVSSGIEPPFALKTKISVHMPGQGGQMVDLEAVDYAFEFFAVKGKTSSEVTAEEHIDVLCTAQSTTDSACSKTCNVEGQIAGEGPGMTFNDYKKLYLRAYEGGAKGCTTFNINGKRAGVREALDSGQDAAAQQFVQDDGLACFPDPLTGIRSCE